MPAIGRTQEKSRAARSCRIQRTAAGGARNSYCRALSARPSPRSTASAWFVSVIKECADHSVTRVLRSGIECHPRLPANRFELRDPARLPAGILGGTLQAASGGQVLIRDVLQRESPGLIPKRSEERLRPSEIFVLVDFADLVCACARSIDDGGFC
jgi:hypothetical protein